ncbi:solute carrier family 49 member 4 isoform X2 [Electrophorus electricus]|uniref:solute carrier family 49 member 4 isoform X2 n=1 Tax=Electrophorus electricus TaxID=8005 RepID=UPI0015D0B091|nr:solute carrier family 49 member 4 isoform X2 [Electrophorus electricus]
MGAVESTEGEREPLLAPSQPEAREQPGSSREQPGSSRVFGRRWVVLALFSTLGFLQGMVWNTWGPIQNSAKHAFGFTSKDVAVLVIWGPVGYIPWLLFVWLMDKKGLRTSLLLAALLMVLGSTLRSVPIPDLQLRRWLIHGGQLLNGLAGPTLMSAGPLLSTTWFAPDERATATAVASLFGYLGAACSFLIGPLAVPAPNDTQVVNTVTHWDPGQIRTHIQNVLYTELGVITVFFAFALLYFPSRPPRPPSVAAASQRLGYRSSICRLLSNVRFLMMALAYSVPTGVVAGWSGVLDMVLTPASVSQVDAGWIGFWSIVGGCVFGVAMARFADSVRGILKVILVLMLAGASLAATWFTLTCLTRLTHLLSTKATLYTSCILVGIFVNSSIPIFFELFMETVYPVPEGITCGVVTFLSNLFTGLLLFFLTFLSTELSWLNWCVAGSCLFSLLLVILFRESYDRLYLDVFVSV